MTAAPTDPTERVVRVEPTDRADRVAARLVRLGFSRTGGTSSLLTAGPMRLWDESTNTPTDDGAAAIVVALARTADPDRAAEALSRLIAAQPSPDRLRDALSADAALRVRLLGVLGASVELGHHLVRHPDDWTVLVGPPALDALAADRALAEAVGADPDDPVTGSAGTPAALTGPEAVTALRSAYRRQLLAIAGRDLSGEVPIEDVSRGLALLAGSTLQAALAVAAAEIAGSRRAGPDGVGGAWELAVVALGKAGGLELNYVSDVDVVFVADVGAGADAILVLAAAERLAAQMMRICTEAVWEVDAGLRPEGKDGPLVRTLASHLAYYQRWASTWEFQALLKARPAAGSRALAERYVDAVAPLVWSAAERPGFVADVQAMRRRVVAQLPAAVAPREIKLGPGGLRDVEFAVQLLQMVHGRGDESLRAAGTLNALDALRDGGFIGRDDAVSLADAYRFLRAAEHRAQLTRLRRTHLVPERSADVARLARSMGFRPDHRGDATDVWASEWALHAREVRRLHEKLFYRPLLDAVARVPSAELRLTTTEAGRRLAALGFAQPERALQHIEALTAGLSRRAAIQRALLPVLLSDFSQAPDPDAGLLRYRQVSDAAGNTPWYLRTLRDEGKVAERLAYLLGTSKYLADLLTASPDALRLLGEDAQLRPRTVQELLPAMRETAARQDGVEAAVRAVRAVRRTELVRIASADLLGFSFVEAVSAGLSAAVDATLAVTLELVGAAVLAARGWPAAPARLAIIAMGRLGGSEVGYGSDADVLFVFEADAGSGDGSGDADEAERAARYAREVAEMLRSALAAPGGGPPMNVDTDLRPEGRDGPLVRSLASYAAYYTRWSATWEAQALLRARFVAGDDDLGARFIDMIEPVRYPPNGLTQAQIVEIRRLKARIDSERLPRGADPNTHTKLGRGGLADVEWTIQLLALKHAHDVPTLRTTSTIDGLTAAAAAGLTSAEELRILIDAWRRSTRTRNALMLVRNRFEEQLPPSGPALTAVGRAMGYPAGFEPGRLDDDYRRVTRRARHAVEEIFYAGDR